MAAAASFVWSLLVVLLSSLHSSYAQTPYNKTLGATITCGTADSSWPSPSGDFAFGCYPLSTGFFLIGIWFDKIPGKTLIWSANRDNPAQNQSTIKLTAGGLLVLTYSNGNTNLVYSGAAATFAIMQDDGNFVLTDSVSKVLWQSFNNATNTILPGQVLVGGQKLYSNANTTVGDYKTGRFMLEMQYDGNLVLSAFRFSDPGYWYTTPGPTPNVSLIFNQSAFMYLVNSTGIMKNFTETLPTPIEDYYHRATIDDYGNFQQFVYPKTGSNNSQWRMVWGAITEPCFVNTVCGVYGFCTSPNNQTVECSCLSGYHPLNPKNPSEGCYPEVLLDRCSPTVANLTVKVEVIEDADFVNSDLADLERITPADLESCKQAVLDDCYCAAATLVDTTCYKKRMPFLNARRSNSSSNGRRALIKVPTRTNGGDIPNGEKNKNSHSWISLIVVLVTSAVLAIVLAGMAAYYHPTSQRFRQRKASSDAIAVINLRAFTFQELYEATEGFSNRIGRGASGTVYRGMFSFEDKHIEIAVKQLDKVIEQGEKEFMTELSVIGLTHHKNLVRLLGFCYESDKRILVYELMKNGTLSSFLFKETVKPSWDSRIEIALGIARGLLYLHEECENQIIHCDIKPQNVLLDKYYTAKIGDFGLAKLLMKDQTRTMTNARGTMGYMAPEWLKNALVTSKVDVYSFGVVLLEVICCRRHIELNRVEEESEEPDLILTDWVLSCMRCGKLEKVVMQDTEVLGDFKRFERMAMVGLWCIHPDPILRPSMKQVTQMLEGTIEVGVPPLIYT